MNNIKFWCEECGNEELEFDAVVTWNSEEQKYEFQSFGDRAWCSNCFTDHHYCEGTEEQCREARDRYEEKVEAEWKYAQVTGDASLARAVANGTINLDEE